MPTNRKLMRVQLYEGGIEELKILDYDLLQGSTYIQHLIRLEFSGTRCIFEAVIDGVISFTFMVGQQDKGEDLGSGAFLVPGRKSLPSHCWTVTSNFKLLVLSKFNHSYFNCTPLPALNDRVETRSLISTLCLLVSQELIESKS